MIADIVIPLPADDWHTIVACLFAEAVRVHLPADMKPEDTDEWRIATMLSQELSTR